MSRSYRFFEVFQRFTNLLLPLLLIIALAGSVCSSVVVWAMVMPMGAIVNSSKLMSLIWFGIFLGVVIFVALIDPSQGHTNNIPEWARLTLFAGNVLGSSSIAFFLMAYFVKQNDVSYELLDFERNRSETSLENMLPPQTADRFDEVSILFADVVLRVGG